MARDRLPSLNARIRMRRTQLGLTGAELAQRAEISPSYVSIIEKGSKVPDEDVAARIARALRDDEDLYRAWARAARVGLHKIDLVSRLGEMSRSPAIVRQIETGEELHVALSAPQVQASSPLQTTSVRRIEPVHDAPVHASARSEAPQPSEIRRQSYQASEDAIPYFAAGEDAEVVRIPILAEGADPGRPLPSPLAIKDRLAVDRRLLADHPPERLFAYQVTLPAMRHLRGLANPGDHVVFQRGGRVAPDRICAVRTPQGLVLSRVLFKGRSLLLLPGEGSCDFESVEVEGLEALPGVIAGTHVLLLRR